MRRWWKAIFVGTQTVILVLLITLVGARLRKEYPAFFAASIIASFLVILGAVKSILEVAKIAGELQSKDLEITKLKLDIEEKERAKAKDVARVVLATKEDIARYSVLTLGGGATLGNVGGVILRREGMSRRAIVATGILVGLSAFMFAYFIPSSPSPDVARPLPQAKLGVVCSNGNLAIYPDHRVVFRIQPERSVTVKKDFTYELGKDSHPNRSTSIREYQRNPGKPVNQGSPDAPTLRIVFWEPDGELVLPLKGPATVQGWDQYVANESGAIRFPLNIERIEVESQDSLPVTCYPVKVEPPAITVTPVS